MAEIRTLDLAIDKNTGTQLYEAYQDLDAGTLYVRQVDGGLQPVGSPEDFGPATETEIDDRTYKLGLVTFHDPSVAGNEDYVIAYGRFQKS